MYHLNLNFENIFMLNLQMWTVIPDSNSNIFKNPIIDIDIAILKTDMIIFEIEIAYVSNLTHAWFKSLESDGCIFS